MNVNFKSIFVSVFSNLSPFIWGLSLSGCSNQEFNSFFGWVSVAGALVTAVGGAGKYYFSSRVDAENARRDRGLEVQVIDLDGGKLKDWRVEKDSPVIIETIDIFIEVRFQIYFEKGDSFNAKDFYKWDFKEKNPILEFQERWNSGSISLKNEFGHIDIKSRDFGVTTESGSYTYRKIENIEATYQLKKLFYLTNTNSLPNSKVISDFDTKIVNRVFNEEDLVKFTFDRSKAVSNLTDLPKQEGRTLQFLLKPKVNLHF